MKKSSFNRTATAIGLALAMSAAALPAAYAADHEEPAAEDAANPCEAANPCAAEEKEGEEKAH